MIDISNKFILTTKLKPKGDQAKAIEQITIGIKKKIKNQILLGATGTGKTFTIANVIAKTNKKTLIIVHNKTLASQLYYEFKSLFKKNRVEYFVSYFDFYQPEAYLPSNDTYIEKSSKINQEIEMARLSTLQSLTTEEKVIVVASVAAIYPSIPPLTYGKFRIILNTGGLENIAQLRQNLVKLQFKWSDILYPGSFHSRGDIVEIMEGKTSDYRLRISFFGDRIEQIAQLDSLNNKIIKIFKTYVIYPANEYIADNTQFNESLKRIKNELELRKKYFRQKNKLIELQRISEKTNRDLEQLIETGFCSGIENYSAHLELRSKGQTPYTIFDYFGEDWLLVVDESHMTIPQIRGMYYGDHNRKQVLVDYGFRLPSCLDNRPLNFDEFQKKIKQIIYVSATPGEFEIKNAKGEITEQIVRPTGLLDPTIQILPTKNQINSLVNELNKQIAKKERTIVVVLTIKIAEELTKYLKEKKYKVVFLHHELKTLERVKIINAFRKGIYDIIIGINLLREGLDIPEASSIVIFDGDKPGIFRSYEALIQIFGRVARNKNGHVIIFADQETDSMKKAILETKRRRNIQITFNKKHNIKPKSIVKPINEEILNKFDAKIIDAMFYKKAKISSKSITFLKKKMKEFADREEYEQAAYMRDLIIEIERKIK